MNEWGKPKLPRLLSCVVCEDAALSFGVNDHRVSIQRVVFDVEADSFPSLCDRLVVVAIWLEGEGEHRGTLRIVSPDGKVVAVGEHRIACFPDRFSHVMMSNFPQVLFEQPGRYMVEVLLNDAPVHSHPLLVEERRRIVEGEDIADQ